MSSLNIKSLNTKTDWDDFFKSRKGIKLLNDGTLTCGDDVVEAIQHLSAEHIRLLAWNHKIIEHLQGK